MPSLLSRFLGKKKNADQSPLLDGEKYESVSKVTSPSAASFDSAPRVKSKEKEQTKRPKRSSAGFYDSHLAESAPILSLSLPDPRDGEKKSQGLGVVFEGITEGPQTLDDEALGEKRLTPSETLVLVQKTSEVLTERGLETLGVMRPHWFASPRQQETQLKLIHRFLATLESQKPDITPSSPSPESAFESELRYSRVPHDVAAVLRWGLRHFQLEGKSFGTSGDWYRTFADKERSSSYPVKAFDDILVPLLPSSHTNLLRATLEMVSSLAAHSEENGISGNKLSKVLGWWIVSNRNIQNSRWPEFYAHWEDAARQFEHIFLAYIRSQDAQSRTPKRLSELVRTYPYVKNRRDDDGIYLPRSRFTTRRADALFVQVTVDKSSASHPHPLRIVEDAFKAVAEGSNSGTHATFWEELRKVASQSVQTTPNSLDSDTENDTEEKPPLNLSSILADESIRLFSLVPYPDGIGAPTLSLFTSLPAGRGRRSLSFGEQPQTSPTINGRAHSIAKESTLHSRLATSSTSSNHTVVADWQVFSNSGFGSPSGLGLAASLWDNDTEISHPAPKKAGGISKRGFRAGGSGPRSTDQPQPTSPAADDASKPTRRTYNAPRLVKLDEAFIDFWTDSLLDSIARTWPTFVICQLKPLPALKRFNNDTPLEWLIIERVTEKSVRLTPPPITTSPSARASSPLPSPTRSEDSRTTRWASSTLSAARKRLSVFSPSKHDSAPVMHDGRDRAAKKAAKDIKVGEMGEVLKEEDEHIGNGVKSNGMDKVPEKSQEPPAVQANGAPQAKETVDTTPEVKAVNQVAATTFFKPVRAGPPAQPSLSFTKETPVPKSKDTVDAPHEVKDINQATPSEPINMGSRAQPNPSPIKETPVPKRPAEVTPAVTAGSGASAEQADADAATSAVGTSSSKPAEQTSADSTPDVGVEPIQSPASVVVDPTTDDVLQGNENDLIYSKTASDGNVKSFAPQPNETEPAPRQKTQESETVGREPTTLIKDAANEDTAHQGEPVEETDPEEPADKASL